jgi:hypothetical protein
MRDGILWGKDDFRVGKLIRFPGQERFNIRGKLLDTRKYDVNGMRAGVSVFLEPHARACCFVQIHNRNMTRFS